MWHALIWIPTLFIVAMWSLVAWGLHALVAWSGWRDSTTLPAWRESLDALQLPAWMAPWFPPESLGVVKAVALALEPWIAAAVANVPAMLNWLPPLVWFAWVVGTLVLLGIAAVLSAIVAYVQRSRRPPTPPPAVAR